MQSKLERLNNMLKQLTPSNATLIRVHQSKSKQSFYCLYFRAPVYFKVFRISDHKPYKRIFDIPTFLWDDDQKLFQSIAQYTNAPYGWFKIEYSEFIVLHYIHQMSENNQIFYLKADGNNGAKSYFHAVTLLGNTQVDKYLSDEFQRTMRKYFGRGVVNLYAQNNEQIVYVTSIGAEVYKIIQQFYRKEWKKDKNTLNQNDLQLPESKNLTEKTNRNDLIPESTAPISVKWVYWKKELKRTWEEVVRFIVLTFQLLFNGSPNSTKKKVKRKRKKRKNWENLTYEELPGLKKVPKLDAMEKHIEEHSRYALDEMVAVETISELEKLRKQLEEEQNA